MTYGNRAVAWKALKLNLVCRRLMPGKSPASRDPDEGHPLLSGCRNRVLHLTTSFVPEVISWMEQALVPRLTAS